jgi:lipid-A-disaccharide synthase
LPLAPAPLFVLVAGEASGDLLGADLIAGLRARFPNARFAGVGGPKMAAAGMEIWHQAEALAVMGLVEVLRHLPRLLALRREILRRTLAARPDVFIGIDAPDFNLGLERKLKAAGVRTAHYVSPSVWAWREKRVEKIGRSADRVLCLFPMEPPIYASHGVDARFVGHPLAAQFAAVPDRVAARVRLGLANDAPVLALLPGSRLSEIRRLAPDFLSAAARVEWQVPNLQIVTPMANAACRGEFEAALAAVAAAHRAPRRAIRVVDGGAHAAMIAADAVLLASGTAALEAMLAKRPMVVAYRLAPLSYRLVTLLGLVRTSVYSLPNILAGKMVVPELMQDDCTPDNLAAALAPLLRADALDAATLNLFSELHESLRAVPGRDAAAAVADILSTPAGGAALRRNTPSH